MHTHLRRVTQWCLLRLSRLTGLGTTTSSRDNGKVVVVFTHVPATVETETVAGRGRCDGDGIRTRMCPGEVRVRVVTRWVRLSSFGTVVVETSQHRSSDPVESGGSLSLRIGVSRSLTSTPGSCR